MTWLLDLLCYVVRNEPVNKMGIKNCAIVLIRRYCTCTVFILLFISIQCFITVLYVCVQYGTVRVLYVFHVLYCIYTCTVFILSAELHGYRARTARHGHF